jgi:hypothetical protein
VNADDPGESGQSSFTESEDDAKIPDPFDVIELSLHNLKAATDRADRLIEYVESRLNKAGIDIEAETKIDFG